MLKGFPFLPLDLDDSFIHLFYLLNVISYLFHLHPVIQKGESAIR